MSRGGGAGFGVDRRDDWMDVGAVLTESSLVDTVNDAEMLRQRGSIFAGRGHTACSLLTR